MEVIATLMSNINPAQQMDWTPLISEDQLVGPGTSQHRHRLGVPRFTTKSYFFQAREKPNIMLDIFCTEKE